VHLSDTLIVQLTTHVAETKNILQGNGVLQAANSAPVAAVVVSMESAIVIYFIIIFLSLLESVPQQSVPASRCSLRAGSVGGWARDSSRGTCQRGCASAG
jgi:hypothetical protein